MHGTIKARPPTKQTNLRTASSSNIRETMTMCVLSEDQYKLKFFEKSCDILR